MGTTLSEGAGDRLRAYIEGVMADRGIASVSELARRAHVSRDTFQAWWRGRPPQRSTAELVARELGVTYADLIAAREGHMAGGTDDNVPPAAYLERVDRLIELVERLLNVPPDDGFRERGEAALDSEEALAPQRIPRSTSPHRRSGRDRRAEAGQGAFQGDATG